MAQTILIVEDDADLAEALGETLEMAGFAPVVTGGAAGALRVLQDSRVDLVVSDVHMKGMDGHGLLKQVRADHPEVPILLMTAYGTIERAVDAMRQGAADYLTKPFEAEALVATVRKYVGEPVEQSDPIAVDPKSVKLFQLAARVAASDATIMVSGESGTGKEVVARYIHRHSKRSKGPFVAINCAAIPDNMLEATLFGYEKGAFTGAYKATPGKFEQAQGGTLLLDEVSEMDLALQAKLLRVIQEREVERLGSRELVDLDVRVLATTNRELREEVEAGRFREDLFYRLNVFPLRLPALRDRPADIPKLAENALARAARAAGSAVPRLSGAARQRLLGHRWPGNVRELDNLMQRAVILAEGEEVQPEDLHFEPVGGDMPPRIVEDTEPEASGLDDGLKNHEYHLIAEALRSGSRKAAAEKLGISPRTLRYKLARMREAGFEV